MHYQMEVVIPESLGMDSKEAAEALVIEALKPFDEDPSGANTTDADADDYVDTRYAFWDHYSRHNKPITPDSWIITIDYHN